MDKINVKMMVLSLLFAGLFTGLLYTTMKNSTRTKQAPNLVTAFVAAREIPERQKIMNEDVREVFLQRDTLSSNAVIHKNDIVNKFAKQKIVVNEQFIGERLAASFEETSRLGVPKGQRAVSITMNELSSVSYNIPPGDVVDVIGVFETEEFKTLQPPATDRITQTIVQNAKILSIGIVEAQSTPSKHKKP